MVLTPAERRGLALIVLLLLIGALHDLWRLHAPARAMRGLDRTHATALSLPAPADTVSPGSTALPAPADRRIDLNAATRGELESLPGIGPVLAGRILERRASGRFRSREELLTVRGIGPRLYERLADRVRVDEPADTTNRR